MERYLIHYLKENASDEIVRKYIDFFKVELDWYIYNYGEHISRNYHRDYKGTLKARIYQKIQNLSALYGKCSQRKGYKNVLSSVYFSDQELLPSLGLNSFSSIFQPVGKYQIIGDKKSIEIKNRIKRNLSKGVFTDLCNKDFFDMLENLQDSILRTYQNLDLRALFLFTDQYFASKYLIDIFKQMDRPSFVFSHGLPAIYSKDVDSRSDYLMVWGEKIKENYIHAGFNAEKIKVVGNVKYKEVPISQKLKNSLDNVLVIPCSSVLWHQHTWDEPHLIDRSMVVLYLYQVQNVLQRFGVKKARFRPHPALDKYWVYGFLDKRFYSIDNKPFVDSIRSSTLVIGATSTTFLETLMEGVNYLLYDPVDDNGISLCNSKSVPPFDGSVPELSIARNERELEYMLKNRYQTTPTVLEGYMRPLDLSVLKEIIK